VVEVRYYEEDGRAPFEEWFRSVDRSAQTRITAAIARLEEGNISNLKSIGGGVHELRMNFGPGYRMYLGRDGPLLIILLTGGTKQRQSRDNEKARALWDRYKRFAQ
jgi:putative addiction module killer protein